MASTSGLVSSPMSSADVMKKGDRLSSAATSSTVRWVVEGRWGGRAGPKEAALGLVVAVGILALGGDSSTLMMSNC